MVEFGWADPKRRFQHMWVVAPSGAGKTTLLKALAAHDIELVKQGRASLIVFDADRPLYDTLRHLQVMDEVPSKIINPELNIGINPFVIGKHTEKNLTMAMNNIKYFIGSLLEGEFTPKQSGLFRRLLRVMFTTKEPTLYRLSKVLEAEEILDLKDGPDKVFFTGPFIKDPDFVAAREQLGWRVRRVFEEVSPAFERIFKNPEGIDFAPLMNTPGITLINTARSLWEEEGAGIFGRLCLAQIKRAGFQRDATGKALPCFVYLDEAHLYVKNDQNAVKMLDGIRKYNVGLVFAHQRTDQLSKDVYDAVSQNSGTIMASQVVNPGVLASVMGDCDEKLITSCADGQFVAYIRRQTPKAVPITIPMNVLEAMPQRSLKPRPDPRKPILETLKTVKAIQETLALIKARKAPEPPPQPVPEAAPARARPPRKRGSKRRSAEELTSKT